MNKNQFLITAAVAGIMGASFAATPAMASHKTAAVKGMCVGGNACKGKSACKTGDNASCKGQNACKGKGGAEMTQARCDKMAKKNKAVHFDAPAAAPAAEEKKS
jgi:uncharacterized membrane protein